MFITVQYFFRFHEIIDDVLSIDEAMPPKFRSRNDQQKHHISKLGSKSKGNYSISDTQKLLKNEKDVNKRKVDVSVNEVLFSESFIHPYKSYC